MDALIITILVIASFDLLVVAFGFDSRDGFGEEDHPYPLSA